MTGNNFFYGILLNVIRTPVHIWWGSEIKHNWTVAVFWGLIVLNFLTKLKPNYFEFDWVITEQFD